MTPRQFVTIGEALKGSAWQEALARDLGISSRTVKRYAMAEHPVPPEVALKLAELLGTHARTLRALRDDLRAKLNA